MFEAALEKIPLIVCLVSASDCKITSVNKMFAKHIIPKKLAVGMSFLSDLLKPEDVYNFKCVASVCLTEAEKDYMEAGSFPTLCFIGEQSFPIYSTFTWSITKVDADTLMISASLPQSVKKNEEEKEPTPLNEEKTIVTTSEFVDFFQNAPIALHWLSCTGHIIWANQTELDALEYTADEYIGHSIQEFLHPDEEINLTAGNTRVGGKTSVSVGSFCFLCLFFYHFSSICMIYSLFLSP